jgi:hypothetical protein
MIRDDGEVCVTVPHFVTGHVNDRTTAGVSTAPRRTLTFFPTAASNLDMLSSLQWPNR